MARVFTALGGNRTQAMQRTLKSCTPLEHCLMNLFHEVLVPPRGLKSVALNVGVAAVPGYEEHIVPSFSRDRP